MHIENDEQTSTQILESKATQELKVSEGAGSRFRKFWRPGNLRGYGHSCTNLTNSNIKGRERKLKEFSRRFENVSKHMCDVLKLSGGSPSRALLGFGRDFLFSKMSLYLCMEQMCYRWCRWPFSFVSI